MAKYTTYQKNGVRSSAVNEILDDLKHIKRNEIKYANGDTKTRSRLESSLDIEGDFWEVMENRAFGLIDQLAKAENIGFEQARQQAIDTMESVYLER
jgi:hypothetical protein